MLKLVEVFLPLRQDATDVMLDLPEGTKVLKFGAQIQQSRVQTPGPNGQMVQLKPLVLCLVNPEAPPKRRRLLLATVGEPIPDGAVHIDVFSLPNGAILHLLEIPLLAELPKRQTSPVQPVVLTGDV